MDRRSKAAAMALVSVTLGAAVSCGEVDSMQPSSAVAGCDSSVAPIDESHYYVPREHQRGGRPPLLPLELIPAGRVTIPEGFPSAVKGAPARGRLADGSETSVLYAFDDVLATDVSHFLDQAGVILRRWPIEGVPIDVVMKTEFADRVTVIPIGEYRGVLSWDDPLIGQRSRPHRVSWSDGKNNYVLVGDMAAEAAVAAARSIVCRP